MPAPAKDPIDRYAETIQRDVEAEQFAFTQTAHSLVPANTRNLMSVSNERYKRTIVPISAADVTRAYSYPVTFAGGAANEGANSDNDGETGTINATDTVTPWTRQKDKAFVLGTTIAPDIGKSYGTKARGTIGPRDPYPTTPPVFEDQPTGTPLDFPVSVQEHDVRKYAPQTVMPEDTIPEHERPAKG